MKAYELYSALLREVNKYQAPDFELGDFNYFFNSQRQAFIDEEKKQFELTQNITDNLRAIAKKATKEITGATTRTCTLPVLFAANDTWEKGKYQHLLGCRTGFLFKQPIGAFKANHKVYSPAKRLTDDMLDYIYQDYYHKPLVDDVVSRSYYMVRGNEIEIIYDTPNSKNENLSLCYLELSYIADPKPVKLVQKTMEHPDNIDSDWPADIDRKVILMTANKFLEINNSSRVQTYMPANQTQTQ